MAGHADPNRRDHLIDLVLELRASLRARLIGSSDPALLMDYALLELELHRALPNHSVPADAMKRAVGAMRATKQLSPWLFGGAAQIGWLSSALRGDNGRFSRRYRTH